MRKLLSFVLVLALVLSSFSMAFATEATNSLSDIAGNANQEAITVNFNLGIIDGMGDGTFAPDQNVTRAQFAAMITRALAIPDSALAGYTATSFKDTSGYSWAVPYLAFCQSKGILVGDGAGNVMPGKTIAVNEAMTMALRAVGYTNNSAALVGVWPANYVTLAQNSKLYDKVAATVTVNRANAAQIIYNALTVDKVEVASDGKTVVLSDRSNNDPLKWNTINMLTTGLDCYSDTGIITGDEDTQINLKPYIGQNVTAFFNSDDEIVAIYSVKSDAITGKFKTTATLNVATDGSITLSAPITFKGNDDVEYTVKDPAVGDYILNGSLVTPDDQDTISKDKTVTINGDVNGKIIRSIATLSNWVPTYDKKVGTADLKLIEDKSLLGCDFATVKDGSIDKNSFDLVGVKSLDDIKADNVVAVYAKGNDDTNDIIKVEVGTKVVEGKVTTTKSNSTKVVVDGTTYEKSDLSGATDLTDIKAGDEVKLFLDVAGKVYKHDITSGTNDKYGVVLKTNNDIDDQAKLYTTNDESAWFKYDSDYADAFATDNTFSTSTLGLVAYGLDKDGKIDTATNGGINAGTDTEATLSALTLKTLAGESFKVSKDCAVFGIDTTKNPMDVDSYTTIGNVDTGEKLGDIAYMTDKDGVVVAIMVDKAHTNKGADSSYAVISDVNSTTNTDEDAVQQVIGFMDGAALDKLTTDKGTADNALAAAETPGLWKVELDSAGNIKKISNPEQAKGVINDGGTVTEIDGNNIKVTAAGLTSDWLPIATDAKVYRAVINDDGDVDVYKVSSVDSINKDYVVALYNTVDDDDSTGADGYDVVIYMTKADAAKM